MAISQKKTTKEVKLSIPRSIRGEDRKALLDTIGEFLVAEIIQSVEAGVSPVQGQGEFKELSKPYADREKNGDVKANLDLNGDMLNALTYKVLSTNTIEVGIFDKDQAKKSYAHNTGYKGHPTLARKGLKRQFIPDEKQKFDKTIRDGIDEIIQEVLDGQA